MDVDSVVDQDKKLDSCKWPPIRNDERLFALSKTYATWKQMDVSNFIRVSVAFFIVLCFIVDLFRHHGLEAFHKIDRALPLDQ